MVLFQKAFHLFGQSITILFGFAEFVPDAVNFLFQTCLDAIEIHMVAFLILVGVDLQITFICLFIVHVFIDQLQDLLLFVPHLCIKTKNLITECFNSSEAFFGSFQNDFSNICISIAEELTILLLLRLEQFWEDLVIGRREGGLPLHLRNVDIYLLMLTLPG